MVTRRRIEALEEALLPHDEEACPSCGHDDGWVCHATRYVDPGTHLEYLEPPRPEPCPACGARPFVITFSPRQGAWKRPGEPEEAAVEMTDEEAGNWWIEQGGNEDLGRWFLSKAGLCDPPKKVNCRLIEYREYQD